MPENEPGGKEMVEKEESARMLDRMLEKGEISSKDASEYGNWQLYIPKERDGEELRLPESQALIHFWEAVESGHFEPMADEEIAELVDTQLSKNEPTIASLSPAEAERVKSDFAQNIRQSANSRQLKRLAEDAIAFVDLEKPGLRKQSEAIIGDIHSNRRYCVINLSTYGQGPYPSLGEVKRWLALRDFVVNNRLGPLSKAQKLEIYSDPTIWGSAVYCEIAWLGDIEHQGIRRLEHYGWSEDAFRAVLAKVRKRTGKQKVALLDIGGGSGKALADAKKIDSDVETYNNFIDEEPAMYPSDHNILCPAEMLPKNLEEKIDFVISNYAFRYFTYPDIVLVNVIKALSVGGEAYIDFSGARSSLVSSGEHQELIDRFQRVFTLVKRLQDEGFLETNIPDEEFQRGVHPASSGQVKIVKKQSTKEINYL